MKIRWIDKGRVDYLNSQCIYHGLGHAHNNESPNTIVLAIPEDPYMCVGHFQDPRKELDFDYCRDNNLPVIRRQTGGGTVYIDNKQLFVQWIFHPDSVPQKVESKFQLFIEPIIETYKFFGIDAYAYRGHDVHVNGKKIVGTGAARIGNAEVITGNFIIEFDRTHMVGALNLPGYMMRSQVNDGIAAFMSSMSSELDQVPDFEDIKNVYKQKCAEIHGMEFVDEDFTEHELLEIEKQNVKLSNDSWTYSMKVPERNCRLIKIHTGVYVGHSQYKVGNNNVDITMRLKEDVIDFIHLYFDDKQYDKLTKHLEESLSKVDLSSTDLKDKLTQLFILYGSKNSPFSVDEWTEALMMIKNEQKRVSGGS